MLHAARRSALAAALCVACCVIAAPVVYAQQLHFVRYTTATGLPEQRARAGLQDSRGFVWIGTAAGLARYDGHRFEVLTKRGGLVDNSITALIEDAGARIVVGTAAGVSVLDGLELRVPSVEGLEGASVHDLARIGDTVVVASSAGLFELPAGATAARPLDRLVALALAVDGTGGLWAAGNGFVRRVEAGRPGPPLPGIHSSVGVDAMVIDDGGGVWLATNAGVFRWNGARFESFRPPPLDTARAQRVLSAAVDPAGTVWMGTWGGLVRIAGDDVRFLTEREGLPDTTVQAVWADREGNVWLGTEAGLAKHVPGPFSTFGRTQDLPSDRILDVAGSDGHLWIATTLGPAHMTPSGDLDWRGLPGGLRYVRSTAVEVASDGTVLVGTGEGLHTWRDGARATFRRGGGLPSSVVTTLSADAAGVWVGLRPGVALWQDGSVSVPSGLAALADATITALVTDDAGRVWIGTERGGTRRYDPGAGALESLSPEIEALDVLSLAVDAGGRVWLGTAGAGAVRVDGATILRIDSRVGLADDFVQQVAVDDAGRVWLFTNRGLDRFDPDTGAITHFDESEGLVALQGSTGAVWHDRLGRLWFGTGAGLVRYDPPAGERELVAPPVVIHNVFAAGRSVPPLDGSVRLAAGSDLRIDFAALSFRNEPDNRFRYRLLGATDAWSEPRPQREVVYGALEPGEYSFEVVAVTPDGAVSETPAVMTFAILPRFYQTWWFRTAAGLALMALALATYTWRAGHLEREQRRLAALVRERTEELSEQVRATEHVAAMSDARSEFVARMSHDLRTPLNGVLGMADLMLFTSLDPRQRRLTQSIRRSGDSLLGLVNDILDLSKVESGRLRLEATELDIVDSIAHVLEVVGERARAKSLALDCHIDPFLTCDLLGDPVRLRQVLLNLVDNAIKFTEEGSVTIAVDTLDEGPDEAHLRFRVEDTGIGIAEEAQEHVFHAFEQADASTTRRHGGTGLGLSIAQQLVAAMGGELRVKSRPAEGSRFTFTAHFRKQTPFRPREDLAGVRIGLVGVDARAATALERQLAGWGATVVRLADAPRAGAHEEIAGQRAEGCDLLLAADTHIDGSDHDQGPRLPVCVLVPVGSPRDRVEGLVDPEWEILAAPAGPRRLYAAIRRALESVSRPREAATIASEGAPLFAGDVLLVEDNAVNQEIAAGMLLHLGCNVRVVGDGHEALEELARSRFDLVLMDCELPRLDGFATATALRVRERDERRPRTPIVALTAGADDDVRARCVEAGMDAFLSKPHTLQEMIVTLARWLQASRPGPLPAPRATPVEERPESLDPDTLEQIRSLQRPGDPDLLERVVAAYLAESARLRAEIEKAVQTGDGEALRVAAHSLKAACGNVGALWLFQLCRRIEAIGRSGDLAAAPEALDQLDAELGVVADLLPRQPPRRAAHG